MIVTGKHISEAGFEFTKLLQRNLRAHLTRKGNVWRRKLWNSIQARRASKKNSILVMSQAGVWLDQMRPHFVKLKKGRLIHRWAMQKGNQRVQAIAMREGSIFVRPHPFFSQVFARTIVSFPKLIKRRAARARKEIRG